MRTIDDMIRQEVHYCVSGLVHTLAQGYDLAHTGRGSASQQDASHTLSELTLQAAELAAPVDDYEEAAIQFGVKLATISVNDWQYQVGDGDPRGGYSTRAEAIQAACQDWNLDPYQREIYEHWLVSLWFAKKLSQHGEKVDTDFAGMTIWARTTTGQAISMDGVVQRIYQEAMK